MEARTPGASNAEAPLAVSARRRKKHSEIAGARFFLPKTGSSQKVPELGQEMKTEGDALIEALKSGQPFYLLTVFRAVAEQNGGFPIITKRQVVDAKTE